MIQNESLSIHDNRYKNIKDNLIRERRKKEKQLLDSSKRTIEKLLLAADNNINICLENRYGFHQVPNIFDIMHLLSFFDEDNLKYWHDIGHYEIQKKLGLADTNVLLSILKRNQGFHLHDVIGFDDHHYPGTGDADFSIINLKGYFDVDTILILELNKGIKEKSVKNSINYLKSFLGGKNE